MGRLNRGREVLTTRWKPSIVRRRPSASPASSGVALTFGLRRLSATRFTSSPSTSARRTRPIASLAARCRATTEPTAPDPIRRTFGGPERMLSNLGGRRRAKGALAYERDGPRLRLFRVSHRIDQWRDVSVLLVDDEDRLAGGERLECRGAKGLDLRIRPRAQDDDFRWRMEPQLGREVVRPCEHGPVPARQARERT